MEMGDRQASLESANASEQHKDPATGIADYHDQPKPECLELANTSASVQQEDRATGIADNHDQPRPEYLESANTSASVQQEDRTTGITDHHDQSKPECLESANTSANVQEEDRATVIADHHDQSKPECLESANTSASVQQEDRGTDITDQSKLQSLELTNASVQHNDLATGITGHHDQSKPKAALGSLEEVSSFSSSVVSDEFFQIDVTAIGKLNTGLSGSSRSNMRPPVHAGMPFGSDSSSMKQSPSIQTMGREEVPGPKRIPSSVFARSSNSIVEWSVASNDSLFSISIERSEDLTNFSGNQFGGRPPVPPLMDASLPKGTGQQPGLWQADDSAGTHTESMQNLVKGKPFAAEVAAHSDSPSTSQLSDGGSVSSYRSFAFPILTSQGRIGSVRDDSACSVQLPTVKERPRPRPSLQDETGDAQQSEEEKESPKVGPAATRRSYLRWVLCCWPSCWRCPSYCWPSRRCCPSYTNCCSSHCQCSCRCFKCKKRTQVDGNDI